MALPVVQGEFRCVADPTLRFSPSGVAVGSIRAVASSRKKVDDEWVDDKTCWVNLTGFKKVAENMAESFEKGDLVVVTGRLQTENWETKDGEKRTSVDIVVDNIGPSLTFNPARSIKGERKEKKKEDPAEDPWATPPQTDEPPF